MVQHDKCLLHTHSESQIDIAGQDIAPQWLSQEHGILTAWLNMWMGCLMEEIFMRRPGPDTCHLFTQRWLEHISLASSSYRAV